MSSRQAAAVEVALAELRDLHAQLRIEMHEVERDNPLHQLLDGLSVQVALIERPLREAFDPDRVEVSVAAERSGPRRVGEQTNPNVRLMRGNRGAGFR